MPAPKINADKPHLWKADIARSVDEFNQWFMAFAPHAFRTSRAQATTDVKLSLLNTNDLRSLDPATLMAHPGALPTLRMCTAPPLAVDRLIGLSGAQKSVIGRMEEGKLPVRMTTHDLRNMLNGVCAILNRMLDRDIFPWLEVGSTPTDHERDRASTIVADRLCSAVANPIVRNAQEQRQLSLIEEWLTSRGYHKESHSSEDPVTTMTPGTFAFRTNVMVGDALRVRIPIDVIIQPFQPRAGGMPILIEAKSAGDFTNTNKRRKEEATKVHQLKASYGDDVSFVLFLCGYFGSDYLGYEAAEGLDWVWEHRIDDLSQLGV